MAIAHHPAALDDIDEIVLYYLTRSDTAAHKFLDVLEQELATLERFPNFGTEIDRISARLAGLRRWPMKKFTDYVI